MDKLKAFFETMTVWNWIALIAFLIALVSGLNAFLSLRSRYRDWKGTRNKKEFENRILELRAKIRNVEDYKKNPTAFFVDISVDVVLSLIALLFSLLSFYLAYVMSSIDPKASVIAQTIVLVALISVSLGLMPILRILPLAFSMRTPGVLAMEVIDFVSKGFGKGLTSEDADELIVALAFSELFTGNDRQVLFDYICKPPAITPTSY